MWLLSVPLPGDVDSGGVKKQVRSDCPVSFSRQQGLAAQIGGGPTSLGERLTCCFNDITHEETEVPKG